MCSWSGWKTRPSATSLDRAMADSARRPIRRVIEVAVSSIGTAKIRSGTPTASAVAPFCQPVIAVTAKTKPITRLPESPRKIEAG